MIAKGRWSLMPTVCLLLSTLVGCGQVQSLFRTNEPKVRIVGVNLRDVNLTSATLVFNVEVTNPYSVDLPVANLDYSLASRGTPFASGQAEIAGVIPANKSAELPMPVTISYVETLSALKNLHAGQAFPYAAELGVSVNAPVVGKLRLPLRKEGELPIPAAPSVALRDVRFEKLSLDSATVMLNVDVGNRNEFPVELATLSYGLSLAGQRVGDATMQKSASFSPGGQNTLAIPLTFSPRSAGLALFQTLLGKGSGYELGGKMTLNTRMGPITVPFQQAGQTTFLH